LVVDPTKRYNVDQCLAHPWYKLVMNYFFFFLGSRPVYQHTN
jgi:hypothetical protein